MLNIFYLAKIVFILLLLIKRNKVIFYSLILDLNISSGDESGHAIIRCSVLLLLLDLSEKNQCKHYFDLFLKL